MEQPAETPGRRQPGVRRLRTYDRAPRHAPESDAALQLRRRAPHQPGGNRRSSQKQNTATMRWAAARRNRCGDAMPGNRNVLSTPDPSCRWWAKPATFTRTPWCSISTPKTAMNRWRGSTATVSMRKISVITRQESRNKYEKNQR